MANSELRKCARCGKTVMRFKKIGKDAFGGPIWVPVPTKSCHIPIVQKPKHGDATYYCNRCFNILNKD